MSVGSRRALAARQEHRYRHRSTVRQFATPAPLLLRLLIAGGFQHIARGSMKSRFLLACLLVACLSLNSATAQHVPLGPLNVEQSKLACALAGATRLESAASCVTGRRSNQLNHAPHLDGLRLYGLPIPPDSLLCPPHSFPPLAPWRDRATF